VKRLFKFTIVGTCVVALLLFGLLATIESRLPIFEYADARYAPAFSFDRASEIKIGDSLEHVREKLGQPLWKIGCGGCWEPNRKCTIVGGHEGCVEWHTPKSCTADCVVIEQM
jgi:hypothetical protein